MLETLFYPLPTPCIPHNSPQLPLPTTPSHHPTSFFLAFLVIVLYLLQLGSIGTYFYKSSPLGPFDPRITTCEFQFPLSYMMSTSSDLSSSILLVISSCLTLFKCSPKILAANSCCILVQRLVFCRWRCWLMDWWSKLRYHYVKIVKNMEKI